MNKNLYFIPGGVILVVGVAAFIAGRMFNSKVSPLSLFGSARNGGETHISINVIPAEELPTTRPEVTGLFVERQDNTIKLQAKGMAMREVLLWRSWLPVKRSSIARQPN